MLGFRSIRLSFAQGTRLWRGVLAFSKRIALRCSNDFESVTDMLLAKGRWEFFVQMTRTWRGKSWNMCMLTKEIMAFSIGTV